MLVLSRKKNESIVINDDITIVVVEIRGDKVRLGVECPKEVPVHRREVFDAIRRNEAYQSVSLPPAPTPDQPAAYPTEITVSGRHVALVDRLRDAIREKSGIAPCRAQTVEAILDGVRELEDSLNKAASLADLKTLLVQTPQNGGNRSQNGHSHWLTRLFCGS